MRVSSRLILALALALVGTGACSSSTAPASPTPNLASVVYEAPATDEALGDLLVGAAKTARTLALAAPSAGQKVAASSVFTFVWAEPRMASAIAPSDRSLALVSGVKVEPRAGSVPPAPHLAWSTEVRQLLALESTAHAHGTPTNGYAYYLTIGLAGAQPTVEVFTTAVKYEPTADQWVALKGAKGTLVATLRAGFFEDNRVISSGGPYDATPISFTIQ